MEIRVEKVLAKTDIHKVTTWCQHDNLVYSAVIDGQTQKVSFPPKFPPKIPAKFPAKFPAKNFSTSTTLGTLGIK
jgi:hypothetical protein